MTFVLQEAERLRVLARNSSNADTQRYFDNRAMNLERIYKECSGDRGAMQKAIRALKGK